VPDYSPPIAHRGKPNRFLLPARTTLWRIHPRSVKATDFTPCLSRRRIGAGRFDGTPADPYPAYNSALEPGTAVANFLLDGIPLSAEEFRTVRRVSVRGQRVSALATTAELDLVSLCDAADLAAVAQDLWLIEAEQCEHPHVRRWAAWIRDRSDKTDGFIWPPRCQTGRRAVVLFGDRCGSAVLEADPMFGLDLDGELGAHWLNSMLVEYRARIMLPRKGT
jgi:hypothetical protein